MTFEAGTVLGGRYRLSERIATGGMGEVWAAQDLVLGRTVAAKLLKPELMEEPGFLERFRAEARHAASLAHPGIASVFDYGEAQNVAYLVMELVDGDPLSTLLGRDERLALTTATSILAQTSAALAAAHAAGVVHRDIKPGNLLLTADGRVKITDFGISKAVGSVPLTGTGQVLGTPQYISPEQATGAAATASSDIYSLGVIGYEMFVGRRPFVGDTPVAVAMAHVHQPPPPLPPSVPAGLAATITAMLAKRPGDRPADAGALALRFQSLLAGLGPATQGPVAPSPPASPPTVLHTAMHPSPLAQGPATAVAPAALVKRARRRSPALIAFAVILAVAVAATIAAGGGQRRATIGAASPGTTTPSTETTVAPIAAAAPVVEAAVAAPPATPAPPIDPNAYIGLDGGEAKVRLQGLGYEVFEERVKADGPKNIVVDLAHVPGAGTPGTVTLFLSDGKRNGHDNNDD